MSCDLNRLADECGLMPAPISGRGQHGWHGNIILFKQGIVTSAQQLSLPGVSGATAIDLTLTSGPLRIIAAHLGLLRNSRAKQWKCCAVAEAAMIGQRFVGDLNDWRLGKRSSLAGLGLILGRHMRYCRVFPHGSRSLRSTGFFASRMICCAASNCTIRRWRALPLTICRSRRQ